MSEGEATPADPGRSVDLGAPTPTPAPAPSWPASPAALSQQPVDPSVIGGPASSSGDQAPELRYSRSAHSPLPWMVATAAAMVAALWAVRWSAVSSEADDPVRSSEWWANVYSVLLPAHELRLGSYSQFRMWVALVLLVVAAVVVLAWIGRIGRNLRTNQAPFGMVVPLLALPAWWVLPISLGLTDPGTRARSDLLVRTLLAFGLLLLQFVGMRWPLLNRIWRAGGLPYDGASVLLWLPMMIPWSMLLLSNAYVLLVADNAIEAADAAWRPTPAMEDWARWLTHGTEVAVLVLLVVVSITQHVGIFEDRRADRAHREALRAAQPGF